MMGIVFFCSRIKQQKIDSSLCVVNIPQTYSNKANHLQSIENEI